VRRTREARSTDAHARLGRALAEVQDWPRLRAAAAQHGLAGLLGVQLLALPEGASDGAAQDGCLPGFERHDWRSLTAAVETRALRMTAVLIKVLAALEDAGVRALPYKGPALAQQLYGDPCLRHFVDLDLVVAPQDARRALDCLERIGWQAALPLGALGSAANMVAEQEVGLPSWMRKRSASPPWTRRGRWPFTSTAD